MNRHRSWLVRPPRPRGAGPWAATVLALATAASLAAAGMVGLAPRPATGHQYGITGYSGNPGTNRGQICTACHSGGTKPDVTLEGPSTVLVGATHLYTLTITGGQRTAGGLDVSVTGGRLDIVPGAQDVQVLQDEITHTEPKRSERGQGVTFNFRWTAPTVPGRTRMYAAGNSVNLNRMPSGDAPDTDDLVLLVVTPGPTTPAPTGSPVPTDTETATVTAPATATATHTPSATATSSPTVPPSATASLTATTPPPSPAPDGGRIYLPLVSKATSMR